MTTPDDFVAEHSDMVHAMASQLRVNMQLDVELADLVAYGFRGLLEARERFDASRGFAFATFAHYRVRGAIFDGVREMARLPRRTHDRLQRAAAMDAAAEASADGVPPSEPPPDVDAAAAALDELLGKVTASFVAAAAGEEERRAPDEAVISQLEQARLRKALANLPPRERLVVRGMYFDERPLDDMGAELGLSRSAVSRIHTRALGLLRERLG